MQFAYDRGGGSCGVFSLTQTENSAYIVHLVLQNNDASRVGLNFDICIEICAEKHSISTRGFKRFPSYNVSRIVIVSMGTYLVDRERAASSVITQFVSLPATQSFSHST